MIDHLPQFEQSTSIAFAAYSLMSVVTAALYFLDKRLAMSGSRRIPERTLHTLELLCGWPGALVAQQLFRHKNRKPTFFLVTWVIAALHIAVWVFV